MQFKSGRHMPLSHVVRWTLGQVFLLWFFLGPFVLLAFFLTGPAGPIFPL